MERRRLISWGKLTLKLAAAVLVGVAVGRHVVKTWGELRTRQETPRIDAGWMVAGGLLYIAGLSFCGVFFGRVLDAGPNTVPMLKSIRAYLISHLGKYVPGKAMVVVMRVGMVVPHGARAAPAAFATLYETLVMMAAGGLVAAIGFALSPSLQALPLAASLGMGLGFLVLVEPRVFPRLSTLLSLPFPRVGDEAILRPSHRLLMEGLLLSTAAWLLLGASQVAVVRGLGVVDLSPSRWPLLVAGVSLATVAGFVAGLPGGLGVREWVLMSTLVPALGDSTATVSALALRLVWVVAEVAAAAVLSPFRSTPARPVAP